MCIVQGFLYEKMRRPVYTHTCSSSERWSKELITKMLSFLLYVEYMECVGSSLNSLPRIYIAVKANDKLDRSFLPFFQGISSPCFCCFQDDCYACCVRILRQQHGRTQHKWRVKKKSKKKLVKYFLVCRRNKATKWNEDAHRCKTEVQLDRK